MNAWPHRPGWPSHVPALRGRQRTASPAPIGVVAICFVLLREMDNHKKRAIMQRVWIFSHDLDSLSTPRKRYNREFYRLLVNILLGKYYILGYRPGLSSFDPLTSADACAGTAVSVPATSQQGYGLETARLRWSSDWDATSVRATKGADMRSISAINAFARLQVRKLTCPKHVTGMLIR